MKELKLGELITEPQNRDAVHIAVAPVIAVSKLAPGDHVGFIAGNKVGRISAIRCVGIVDPFLRGEVNTGEQFWLYLYPGSITSLRHDWTHPAFKDNQ